MLLDMSVLQGSETSWRRLVTGIYQLVGAAVSYRIQSDSQTLTLVLSHFVNKKKTYILS